MGNLKLPKEENFVIEFDAEHMGNIAVEGERSLVGKLLSDRKMNKEVIRATTSKIWKLRRTFTFHEIISNLFVVTFCNQRDRERESAEGEVTAL